MRTMTDRISHRGPDAAGFTDLSPQAALQLAHRRLSIIDLSTAADQPFVKHGLHLSYNGELYNYRELRNTLRGRGVQFSTESDTEVVLECWRHWGPAALPKFRGMFAFALYDERDAALTLVRDPLGIKPMYVMPRGSGILFASELKALVAAVGPELTVDLDGLVASTLFYFLPEEQSAVKGVFKLPAGIVGRSGVPTAPSGPDVTGSQPRKLLAAATGPTAELEKVLEESVAAHMVADVPVASFLSGGLDSSLITAMAAHHDPSIEAYTITFRAEDQRLEAMPDDAAYARKMAAHLGIRLHEIEISPDVVDMLPRVVEVLDEPIGDPAAINTVLMCQAARDAGVKVLLSGMGADELFGGYRKHLACVLGAQVPDAPAVASLTRGGAERQPAPCCGRRARTSLQPVGQAIPQLRRVAGRGGVPPQLHPLRPSRARGAARSRTGTARARCCGRASHLIYRQPAVRPRQSDVPHRHSPVPARDSTWPTPTARACRRRRRCGCPSSTPTSFGPPSASVAARRSRDVRRRFRCAPPQRTGCRARWSIARRPRSALRCVPGSPTISDL